MERSRDGQRQRALGTGGLEHLAGLVHTGLGAGDDGLLGIVEVDGLDGLAHGRRGGGTALAHGGGVQAQDGGHGADAHRHGVLHGLRAEAHQRQGIGQAQRLGGDQGAVLTQRMTGHDGGLQAGLGQPGAVAGDAGGQHHGLGVGGQVQLFLGAVLDQAADVLAQGGRRLLEGAAHFGVIAPGVQHAHGLRPLAGEHECKARAHRLVSFLCSGAGNQRSSRTAPQVKPPPTPSSMTVSPFLIWPERTAASSASGIDAAEVLPC